MRGPLSRGHLNKNPWTVVDDAWDAARARVRHVASKRLSLCSFLGRKGLLLLEVQVAGAGRAKEGQEIWEACFALPARLLISPGPLSLLFFEYLLLTSKPLLFFVQMGSRWAETGKMELDSKSCLEGGSRSSVFQRATSRYVSCLRFPWGDFLFKWDSLKNTEHLRTTQIIFVKGFHSKRKSIACILS